MKFFVDKETQQDILLCDDCLAQEINKSDSGFYQGDEIVKADMFIAAGEHGQCDLCLEQCEDYPDCENS